MASEKEITSKIRSVKNIQKITKAMEMVAASKMRKSQDRIMSCRPYAEMIRKVISHFALNNLDSRALDIKETTLKRVGYLVISSDHGLCGGLNINLFKKLLLDIKYWSEQGVKIDLALIGSKAASFFDSIGGHIIAKVTGISDKTSLVDFLEPANVMLQAYETGRFQKLYIASNKFINTMSREAQIVQLLPLPAGDDKQTGKQSWNYLYEPNQNVIRSLLIRRYVESQVYQGVMDNMASEQAARMVAMKAATDNSGSFLKELKLVYNKARQGTITQELTEIISGASAM
ncbi:ATP synthase gamma chain [Serratia symbiotica]|nr:ATP synthase gamma chain [Serratia symbiotica]